MVLLGSGRSAPAADGKGARTAAPASAPAIAPAPIAADVDALANSMLGLRGSTLVNLDIDHAAMAPMRVTVPIDGAVITLDLKPHSVRAPEYKLHVQIEDGTIFEAQPAPSRTLRGSVVGRAGSIVTASALDDGLHATIRIPNTGIYWIEPIAGRVPGARPGDHVIYASEAIIPNGGKCGVSDDIPAKVPDAGEGGVAGVPCPGELHVTQLACDADFEYYQHYGSSVTAVENRINAVINSMNAQYEDEVSITHVITDIIVRTAEPDPYTSASAGTLLGQFRNEWLAHQTAVPRDVAMLFTGRNITGSIIGIAYGIGEICTTGAYCLVQSDCCGSFGCSTDLSAHEIGHLWNCTHCPCDSPGTANDYTMNASILCANQHSPVYSIPSIITYRNSISCLTCQGAGPGPANNNCSSAVAIGDGTLAFTTVDASTDGPAEPGCNFGDETQLGSDIWYRYQASCTGQATASLCGSAYNTKIAIYHSACPTSSGEIIACNDDFDCNGDGHVADDGFVSRVSWPVMQNSRYLIRVGGFGAAEGTGTLNVSCTPVTPPANDLCANATVVSTGAVTFTTVGATGIGPALPASCDEGDGVALDSDIWYQFQAICNGTLTVRTCNFADFDTRLAVYRGTSCSNLVLAGCNDDSPTCTAASSVVQISPVTCNEFFWIRLGSRSGIQGTGTLLIGCAPVGSCAPAPCPADFNGSGVVDTLDLGVLLSSWSIPGTAPGCGGALPCAADLNGDGFVNSLDLGTLLSGWGPCS